MPAKPLKWRLSDIPRAADSQVCRSRSARRRQPHGPARACTARANPSQRIQNSAFRQPAPPCRHAECRAKYFVFATRLL